MKRLNGNQMNYASLFWMFMAGSVLGYVLEGLWCLLRKGAWENHVSTVWGPLCLVYGVGAVALYVMGLVVCNWQPTRQFLMCALAGTAVEYFTSLFQEICFGSRSWDYSNHYIHINGRVSLRMTLMWGALGMCFIRWGLPALQSVLTRMQGQGWHIVCIALSCWLAVNLLVTSAALGRWKERQTGESPSNPVEIALDAHFPNTRMETLFNNMTFN